MISILLIYRHLLIFSKDKVHHCTTSEFTVCPDLSAVIFDDLAYDGKTDSTSSFGRIPGCSARKNRSKIAGRSFAAIPRPLFFDLNLDEITHIFDTDAVIAFWLIHIFVEFPTILL